MGEFTGVAAALTSTLIWAYSSVLFQGAVGRYGAFTCNLAKALVGMILFWICVAGLGAFGDFQLASSLGNTLLLLSGIAGMALGDWAYFAAIRRIGVRQSTLIHGTAPLYLLLWNLFASSRALSRYEVAGVLLVIAGVSVVSLKRPRRASRDMTPTDPASHSTSADAGAAASGVRPVLAEAASTKAADRRGRPTGSMPETVAWVGILCAVGAALGQAIGILLSHQALQECHPLSGAAVRLTGAVAGLTLVQICRGRLLSTGRQLLDRGLWRVMLLPSFLGTFVGIFFMMIAIERAAPAVSGALLATTPIFVIPFAVFMLKERVTLRAAVGTSIVVAGVALVSVAMGDS